MLFMDRSLITFYVSKFCFDGGTSNKLVDIRHAQTTTHSCSTGEQNTVTCSDSTCYQYGYDGLMLSCIGTSVSVVPMV